MADYKKDFLDTVEEQIAYKPLRGVLGRELEEHILDRMEEYEAGGASREEAEKQAVEDMGDPVVIGTELNEVHRIQKAPALTAVTFLLLLSGLVGSVYMRWSPEQFSNGFLYYIPGLLVLAFMAWKGYPLVVRCFKWLPWLAGCLFLAGELLCGQNAVFLWQINYFRYFGVLLFAPFLILLAYRLRRQGSKTILLVLALCGVCIFLPGFRGGYSRDLSACVVLAAGVAGTLLMMARRDIFTGEVLRPEAIPVREVSCVPFPFMGGGVSNMGNRQAAGHILRRRGFYGIILGGLAVMGCLLTFTDSRQQVFLRFVNPDAYICSTWDDTYNSALIRRLLSRTPLVGGIDLTSRELMDYGTGAWYFEKRDPRQIGINAVCETEEEQREWEAAMARAREEGVLPRSIRFDESNVTLWDILPQHYHNNYRIALCILLFGWLAGAVVLAAVGGFYLLLFACIRKIRGRLAFSLSCCCGICLAMEGILYILGNFGYQYASFTSLPMIAEGRISIVVHMAMLGLVFSAYRYDRVAPRYLEDGKYCIR